jgi:hypothetical protein
MKATTPTTKPRPALEQSVRNAAAELAEEAATFASFVDAFADDLCRSDQFELLAHLGRIGRHINKVIHEFCRRAGEK